MLDSCIYNSHVLPDVYRPNELISIKAVSLMTKELQAILLVLCTVQFIVQ